MINRFIKQTEPKMIALIVVSLLLLTVLSSYLYVFKEPIKSLQKSQQTLQLLQAEKSRGQPLNQKITELEQQQTDINRVVNASGQQLPENEMIAYVIGQFDVIAAQHQVQLVSVEPGNVNDVFMFRELPFNVEITGGYFDLYNWLNDVENKLGPMVVKSFNIAKSDKTTGRRMQIVMVAYLSRSDV